MPYDFNTFGFTDRSIIGLNKSFGQYRAMYDREKYLAIREAVIEVFNIRHYIVEISDLYKGIIEHA